ncbi:Helix-turn-helix domain protein [compost metagenome]
METSAFIEALRSDITHQLREEILSELQPEINRRLYSNIFDIKEACQYLKICRSTLLKMVHAMEVPHFWQRGQIFFRQIDLDADISSKIVGRRISVHE